MADWSLIRFHKGNARLKTSKLKPETIEIFGLENCSEASISEFAELQDYTRIDGYWYKAFCNALVDINNNLDFIDRTVSLHFYSDVPSFFYIEFNKNGEVVLGFADIPFDLIYDAISEVETEESGWSHKDVAEYLKVDSDQTKWNISTLNNFMEKYNLHCQNIK